MKRYIIPISLCSLAMLAACSGGENKEQQEETKKPLVKVQRVDSREVIQEGNYTATVDPFNINNISSSMPNRIKKIYVDEGYNVSKGQRIAVLDDVNMTTYELQVSNAKANLENIQREYDRAAELLKIGGGTQQAVDQMQLQLTNAKNALATAERTLRNCQENTILVSPISGVVTARNYDPGDMTGSLPIVTVAQVNPLKIVINVSESEFSKVKKGMPAQILFDTYAGEEFAGTVTMVSPVVDSATRTFAAEVTMNNANGKVVPGMFGRVKLNLGSAEHVVVPDLAVVKQPGSGNHFVFVYKDGKVTYNKVELGRRLGDSYELLSGVNPGDEVVITGQSKLINGSEVEVAK